MNKPVSPVLALALLGATGLPLSAVRAADAPPAAPAPVQQVPILTPEEELKTFQLPEGYQMELVLSDPLVKEPVALSFDGNGRMYIAEMRTYMQNIDGTGELTPHSRISRHESTKGDGVFDKHSVYIDNLLLPRMILPLDDRILVGITNTSTITMYRDTKGTGVADESSVWYEGKPNGGNLEHQASGLVWGLDNWIYTTYNNYRLRWNGTGKAPSQEPIGGNGGQWGLTQDDYGKMWVSNAGGEKGIWNYQTPLLYGAINVSSQKPEDFDTVWPAAGVADFQGGPHRVRPEDNTLNHFTGCCGHVVNCPDTVEITKFFGIDRREPKREAFSLGDSLGVNFGFPKHLYVVATDGFGNRIMAALETEFESTVYFSDHELQPSLFGIADSLEEFYSGLKQSPWDED